MTPLQSALAEMAERLVVWPEDRLVFDAARSLAEGKPVWWCETHHAAGRAVRCDKASKADVSCRMVEKILADPPEEKR